MGSSTTFLLGLTIKETNDCALDLVDCGGLNFPFFVSDLVLVDMGLIGALLR
jgi:hypothetical protein